MKTGFTELSLQSTCIYYKQASMLETLLLIQWCLHVAADELPDNVVTCQNDRSIWLREQQNL